MAESSPHQLPEPPFPIPPAPPGTPGPQEQTIPAESTLPVPLPAPETLPEPLPLPEPIPVCPGTLGKPCEVIIGEPAEIEDLCRPGQSVSAQWFVPCSPESADFAGPSDTVVAVPSTLPVTGSGTAVIGGTGFAALAIGAVMMRLARRH